MAIPINHVRITMDYRMRSDTGNHSLKLVLLPHIVLVGQGNELATTTGHCIFKITDKAMPPRVRYQYDIQQILKVSNN